MPFDPSHPFIVHRPHSHLIMIFLSCILGRLQVPSSPEESEAEEDAVDDAAASSTEVRHLLLSIDACERALCIDLILTIFFLHPCRTRPDLQRGQHLILRLSNAMINHVLSQKMPSPPRRLRYFLFLPFSLLILRPLPNIPSYPHPFWRARWGHWSPILIPLRTTRGHHLRHPLQHPQHILRLRLRARPSLWVMTTSRERPDAPLHRIPRSTLILAATTRTRTCVG